MSPYSFILVVKILPLSIKNNNKINGVNTGNDSIYISQLAEDTLVFLNDIAPLDELINIFEKFKSFSGLKMNKKNKAVYVGSLKNSEYYSHNLDWSEKIVETLGVVISGNELDHYKYNFKPTCRI